MIAKNRERLGSHRAGRNMEDRAGEFTGDLVHIGDHQQQALAGGKGRRQCAGLQCTVNGTCCPALCLHFDNLGNGSPDIRMAHRTPLVSPLTHVG